MSESKSRDVDQESRRLIREDLLTNILVEAGAGSGKTQMLAERMAAGVAVGVYRVEHMAAVTFTRKAASELRGRFHLALEGELSKARAIALPHDAGHQERIARIQAALSNLERFFAARFTRSAPASCVSGPSSPVCRPVSRNSTRSRIWNCGVARGGTSLRARARQATPT
jgi:ATP-dependent exoDNAse (exonuclease V) beta subunit